MMKLSRQTGPQIQTYLNTKNEILIPIGSQEQHGPTGFLGTDFLTAQAIALAIGNSLQILVAPPICYGMSLHHMAFPGTVSLKPSTLILFLCDILESFEKQGFKKIYFINGHGGNIAALQSAFAESKKNLHSLECYFWNWWNLSELDAYHQKHFGNENGFHATCGEISVTMFTHDCTNQNHLNPSHHSFQPVKPEETLDPSDNHPILSAQEFQTHFPDGRMGSNPSLASKEHGKMIFELSVQALCQKIKKIQNSKSLLPS